MSVIERMHEVLATSAGQSVGWILILAMVLWVFNESGSDGGFLAIVIVLGMSWILGASYGRRKFYDETDRNEEAE